MIHQNLRDLPYSTERAVLRLTADPAFCHDLAVIVLHPERWDDVRQLATRYGVSEGCVAGPVCIHMFGVRLVPNGDWIALQT